MTRRIRAGAIAATCAVALSASGCGGDDFKNDPRPAVPLQLTGSIKQDKVTVSPDKVGAGPIVILIANLTKQSHTVTLESAGGGTIREQVGPINPGDTATIQRTLTQGDYTVKAGSEQAVAHEIEPATLRIGRPRKSGSDQLLLP